MRLIVSASALAAALGTIGSASRSASADTNDVVMAEVLFRDGKELLAQGDTLHACPKLSESYRLDAASGTLLALALCHEREGKLASAWAEYEDVAARSKMEGRADRAGAAHAKAVELEPKLSSLTIVLADNATPKGIEVRRNGAAIPMAWLGTAVPVDGGAVTIEVSAPKKRPWRTALWMDATGDRRTVTIPVLEAPAVRPVGDQDSDAEGSTTTPPESMESPSSADSQPAPPADTHHGLTGWQVAGLVTGAVAVIGLGVGGTFGVIAMNKNNDSKTECLNGGTFCTLSGQQDRQDALNAGDVSSAAFIGGGVLAVAGAAMYMWGRPREEHTSPGTLSFRALPTVGPQGVGGVLRGSF
jgi:serine/threonine-protein kinase